MRVYRTIIVFGLIFFLIGCSATDNSTGQEDGVNLSYITSNHKIDQHDSNRAKKMLHNQDPITSIHAVNTEKKLLIAIEIKHHHRFALSKIEKNLQKKVTKAFPNKKVELSTDKKMVIELNRLEKDIDSGNISKKKLNKKINQLVTLMHEQT
ncbi:YhcN/YlaJ family sporulation lipoprotein [Virgibacillus siamensis]|uniref:YhcN/YlaJ family sporulation lipoprotein n=1 Tax=Virgibacillus siamensis TaxID=480071 RepID=UPI00098725A8|nr:YhcN/YlaJ family sporulation lipoprotein [Virgibacillus siamensis]